MTIDQATRHYEEWLAKWIPLVPGDLRLKHDLMKRDGFAFLRATFYRWMQVWPHVCPELAGAPSVLAVGDLHVENFGTWRDSEGRLIWGINDFDEVYTLPYTNDLVRLAVSAELAIDTGQLDLKLKDVCDAILTGYTEGLQFGGRPFVLSERHPWLRDIATNSLRDPGRFWRKMQALRLVRGAIPQSARRALLQVMPERGLSHSFRHRVSGLGSLGRPRYVALAEWRGGAIAREAKAMVPSACVWAQGGHRVTTILYQSMLDQAVRCRDPFVQMRDRWLIRRLSPYCSRIELSSLPKKRDEARLLQAMGWEAANIHLGSRRMKNALEKDLAKRKAKWLRVATKAMRKATVSDWKDWARK